MIKERMFRHDFLIDQSPSLEELPMYHGISFCRRLLGMLAAIVALYSVGANEAAAQRFQHLFGTNPNIDATAGYNGVKQLGDGGYILVGNLSIWFPTSSAYIVRTWPDGSLRWAKAYNIGNADSAMDVAVLINEADTAGNVLDTSFLVCGVTNNSAGACPSSRDGFLLKVDKDGNYLAHNTFGNSQTDEIFNRVIQTQAPWSNNNGCNAGDYVAVGSSTYNAGFTRDGYIVRVDKNLNLIWDGRYGGRGDDYFNGVTEALATNVLYFQGEIIAVGATNTGWSSGVYDVLAVRVLGYENTPLTAATYGRGDDEEGTSVIELRNGPSATHLAIAGVSKSRPAPSSNSEIVMIEVDQFLCDIVADQFAGDDGPEEDGAMDLKEDAFDCRTGDGVIATGYTSFGDASMVAPNVFLQSFLVGSMDVVGGGMAYGGDGDDRGWSVDNATNSSPQETQGYIISGVTKSPSFIGGVSQRMYLIKTDARFTNSCNQYAFDFSTEPAQFNSNCFEMPVFAMGETCKSWLGYWDVPEETQLCYTLPRSRKRESGNDGVASAEPALPPLPMGVKVTNYPNPVVRNEMMTLQFELASATSLQISIADVSGHVVYRKGVHADPGLTYQVVETDGWPVGTYVVRVTTDHQTYATRFVVLDR